MKSELAEIVQLARLDLDIAAQQLQRHFLPEHAILVLVVSHDLTAAFVRHNDTVQRTPSRNATTSPANTLCSLMSIFIRQPPPRHFRRQTTTRARLRRLPPGR